MKFQHLLQLIRLLKKNILCPGCKRRFKNEDISIIDLCDSECSIAVICEACSLAIEVDIMTYDDGQEPTINISAQETVTKEDIENIAKALSNHKGSLEGLFGTSSGEDTL